MIEMVSQEYYGVVKVSSEIFERLNPSYFISHSNDKVKYMCANQQEYDHLTDLGISCLNYADWYKIILED